MSKLASDSSSAGSSAVCCDRVDPIHLPQRQRRFLTLSRSSTAAELGYQAAERVNRAPNPLKAITEISQNFPNLATSLARLPLSPQIGVRQLASRSRSIQSPHVLVLMTDDVCVRAQKEHEVAHRAFGDGTSVLLLNGVSIDPASVDPFKLYDVLLQEVEHMALLNDLDVPVERLKSFVNSPSDSQDSYGARALRIDLRTPLVKFLNNIEKDQRYRDWPSGLEIVR